MNLKSPAITLLVTMLSSCATMQDDMDAFNKKPICCNGYNDMLFWKWDGTKAFHSSIKSNAPIYVFEEGRSRFTAVEFTGSAAPSELWITARSKGVADQNPFNSPKKALFYPAVTFLDGTKNKILPSKDHTLQIELITSSNSDTFTTAEAKIKVPNTARFAIIHSASVKFGEEGATTAFIPGGLIYGGSIYAYRPDTLTELKFLYSPSAEIELNASQH